MPTAGRVPHPARARSANPETRSAPSERPRSAHWTSAIGGGDTEAFASFYDVWFEPALRAARRITRRDEAFCLDVVQDTMLRVANRIPALATEAAVDAWMARAVFSAAVDRIRQERARDERERRVAAERPDDDAGRSDPGARLDAAEELEWLRARLDELPPLDRQLVVERFSSDGPTTLDELGRTVGLSGNAVHGRLRRALERLRRAATEWNHD